MFLRTLVFLGASALSGCGYVVTSTLLDVGALDPFSSDPGGFAIGIDTGAGLSLIDGSVTWTFSATHSPSGETQTLEAVLVEDRTEDGLIVYTLPEADVVDLRRWQQELLAWKETSDGNSSLSFSIGGEGCRIEGVSLADDPRISVFLRLAEDAPMRPFVRNAPVLDFLETDAGSLEALPTCGVTL